MLVKLNSRIFDRHVFNRTENFFLAIDISEIPKGTFLPFHHLKHITISLKNWQKLMHKGIDWIYDLNSHLSVNLSDSSLIQQYAENCSLVIIHAFRSNREHLEGVKNSREKEVFPDEDFCIYSKFPFEQMIFIFFHEFLHTGMQTSCTYAWLSQYYPAFQENFYKCYYDDLKSFWYSDPNLVMNVNEFEQITTKCNFNQR